MRWKRKARGQGDAAAPDSIELHARLSEAASAVYAAADDVSGLSAAIDVLERGLARVAADHPHRGIFLGVLGEAFGLRFSLTSVPADIEAAVAFGEQAVVALPADDPQRGVAYSRLAEHYIVRFEAVGNPSDLDATVGCCEQALAEALATPVVLARLAYAHQCRAELGGAPADVDAQIRHAEHGLEVADAADSYRPVLHELAAAGYERRYERARDVGDLDAAITCRKAVVGDGLRGGMLARDLSNLSFAYLERYEATGGSADVHSAIDCAGRALEIAGEDNRDYAELLYKLGLAFRARFNLAGDAADLRKYVELTQESRRRASAHYQGIALVNLAVSYVQRYEYLGDHRDLEASIEVGEEALAHGGLTSQQRGTCVANLSKMYRKRFERYGAQGDLDHAVQLGHRAVRALPDGHPELVSRLEGLANAYSERFERFRDLEDLTTAVELGERALAIAGIRHTERRQIQSNLSGYLLQRYLGGGDPADLDASAGYSLQALGATDEADPQWAQFADALAGALLHRHRLNARTGEVAGHADLDKAIDLIARAATATGPDSPFFLMRLQNLAVAYQEEAVDPERRAGVVRRLVEAVGTATDTTPTAQASARTNIGRLALQAGMLTEAAAMWRGAVELLPLCAPQGLAWSDQEHQLSHSGGLVGEATATLLAIGDVAGAVELAELGRGILLSNQLSARIDLAELSRSAPDLAEEFKILVAEMDTQSPMDGRLHDLTGAPAPRRPPRHLADRWDQPLHRIREFPEFAGFLVPPRIAELQSAAADGAVVLVNVGTLGGDAVVLKPDALLRVRLPELTEADARAHANALAGVEFFTENRVAQARTTQPAGATHDLLAWLWETVTGPVLTALGYDTPPDAGQPTPRVWWVATGVLSLLPLHAAGLPDGPSALDRVVSSYTPTIRALILGRQRTGTDTRTQLTVTMRHTDGLPDLPATAAETAYLLARNPDAVALADGEASAAAVLDALSGAGWVHFACHATSHPEKASKSGLHLHDRMLRVPEISGAGPRGGEFAYLSACSTGQGSLFQADQAIHLASAFQLAGYRHVVATLWSVNDQVAAMAARRFYRLLGDSSTADGAAVALHDVTRRLRARFPAHPELWAPFVHSGP